MDRFGLEHFCPPRNGSRCSPGSAPKAMPARWSSRTTPIAGTDMLSEDDKRRTRPHWHYTHISTTSSPRSGRPASPRVRSSRCSCATPGRSSRRRREGARDAGYPGTGGYRYEVVDRWAKLPPGREFNADVAAVGVDTQDRVYAFNRGQHPMSCSTVTAISCVRGAKGVSPRARRPHGAR